MMKGDVHTIFYDFIQRIYIMVYKKRMLAVVVVVVLVLEISSSSNGNGIFILHI